jgi:DNA-binding NarL/FixJ family response regulator
MVAQGTGNLTENSADGHVLVFDMTEMKSGPIAEIRVSIQYAAETLSSEGVVMSLSEREQDVIRLLSEGLTDDAVARRLNLSRRTVGNVVATLMRNFGARTRFQLGLALRPDLTAAD